jgi:hypothetical protein
MCLWYQTSYGLVSTTRWVGMSENMKVSVILKMNGCLPCVVGTRVQQHLKLWPTPFLEILSYMENMSVTKVFIKWNPACVKFYTNKPSLILDIYPYAYTVILFRRVRLDLLSTLYSPLLCWTEERSELRSWSCVWVRLCLHPASLWHWDPSDNMY